MKVKRAYVWVSLAVFCLTQAGDAKDAGVIYTIAAEEALTGPKPADPNYIFVATNHEASITVDAAKIRDRISPLTFGACFEDLNHEIYGGLYAQMIYGESFEAGAARNESGDLLALKVVNFAPFALNTKIYITGMREMAPTANIVLLTGKSLKEDNTAENPERIAPMTGQISDAGSGFQHVFPAYSYTIIQL